MIWRSLSPVYRQCAVSCTDIGEASVGGGMNPRFNFQFKIFNCFVRSL
jgi:hypothetical protein